MELTSDLAMEGLEMKLWKGKKEKLSVSTLFLQTKTLLSQEDRISSNYMKMSLILLL